jgi:hypothetical protein
MRRRVKQSALLLVGFGVIAAVVAPVVIAAGGDTDDHVSPANTTIKAKLKPGTKSTFVGKVTSITVTEHCTGSTTSGKTPARGLGPVPTTPPTFTGCTDSLNGKDTTKVTGTWKLKFVDAANDESQKEPNSGDKLKIIIPMKGATVTSSFDPKCHITAAPTAVASVSGAYNDVNTLKITNAPLPAATSSGCPGGAHISTAHFSATYVLTPGMHDVS